MKYALKIEKLTKIYKCGIKALNGIDLSIKSGDFYALLGPNEAGKSTLIGIISGLVNKTSGTVRIFNHDTEKDSINAKRKIGLVPQEFNFNPFETAYQILINQAGYYGVKRKIAKILAEKYLKQLNLWDKRNKRSQILSGGMKRRLMIIRALMHTPNLLVLDEPTAGVDIEIRRSMWDFLRNLNNNGITIILTTHYLEEAEMLCRNIGVICEGLLVENTSVKNLISKLKSETFILDLDSKVKSINIHGYQSKIIDNNTIEINVLKGQGLNNLFFQLDNYGIKVLSMRNKANRLEELFMTFLK